MNAQFKDIRTFIGAQDYEVSKAFYRDLGFEELEISEKLSLFNVNKDLSFYLQDYYVKDWVDNSMVMLAVEDVHQFWAELQSFDLESKYDGARLKPVQEFEWGRVCFLHDPAGVLWHFCEFS